MDNEIEDGTDSQADEVVDDSATDNAVDVSVYEAAIAERDAAIATLHGEIQTLKAHNYTLMSSQTREADDTGIVHSDEDTPDDVTIDDLFTEKD